MAQKKPRETVPPPVEPKKQREMIVVKTDPNAPPLYTNNVVIELTPWDLKFHFGELLSATATEYRVLERLTVVMSPQHAAVMAQLLNQHIEIYQNTFGSIPTPKGRVAEPISPPST
jgi:Protein of unknown function (DUF3467)